MKMIIRNTNIQSEKFDFIVPCEVSINQKITYVDFDFEDNEKQNLTGKFFLNIDEDDLVDFNFHHIKTTNIIFFRFLNRWGIIDIKKKQIKRNEIDNSLDCPFFYLHENCILIVDDLFAETITLAGETIDRIGNEQPYEIKELDDYFEFDICGVGKRKLMKKASANNGFIKWLGLGFSFGKTSMSRKFVYICFGL